MIVDKFCYEYSVHVLQHHKLDSELWNHIFLNEFYIMNLANLILCMYFMYLLLFNWYKFNEW